MTDDVKKCIDLRIDYLHQYFTIPQNIEPEINCFIKNMADLGEQCTDAAEFEQRFSAEGLSNQFNAILPKCTPRPVRMTKEHRKHSREVAKEMLRENRGEIIRDVIKDTADYARLEAESEFYARNRERMIENGTFDDYTRSVNAADAAGRLFRFLGGKFRKK